MPDNIMISELHNAAIAGDLRAMRRLLNHGADPEKLDDTHRVPALVAAARAGHPKAIELLLEFGANINGSSEPGDTALHAAVHFGNLDIVRLLIDRGADVNAMSEYGPPLIVASLADQIDCVRCLLDQGAHVSEEDISFIKESGHAEIVSVLEDFIWNKTHNADGLPLTEKAFIDFGLALAHAHEETERSLEEYLRSLWTLVQDCKPSDASFPRFAKLLADSFTAPIAPFQEEWNSHTRPPDRKKRLAPRGQFEIFKQLLLFQIADLHNMGDDVWNNPWRELGSTSPTGNSWNNLYTISYLTCAMYGCAAHMKNGDNTKCNWMFLTWVLELGAEYE